jgi:2-C-methyl-D-erythritol 2,4-cyclodiphosphate synthase
VLLHALVDALLGACGWGDIGEWFPESAVEPGQASSAFVTAVMTRMREQGMRVVNADAVIDLESVRLSGLKPAIKESVASLLGVPPGRVNIKAKTAEGLGAVGEGRAVSAQAVVLVEMLLSKAF